MADLWCLVGGGGFIGTNLARHLMAEGHRVRLFGHPPADPALLEGLCPDGIPLWQADLKDRDALREAVAGCKVVVHLVGATNLPATEANNARDVAQTVEATLGLLDMGIAGLYERLVFVSSGGTVYGVPDRLPIPEDSPHWPISSYGVGKLAVERYLHVYHHLHGLDYRIARVANPYGPGQRPGRGQGVVAALLHSALTGRPFPLMGEGSVVRDYVAVADVCAALSALGGLADPLDRVVNVGSGMGLSVREMIRLVEEVSGRPILLEPRPARSLDVPASVLDISRARRMLGWAPVVSLRDGLAEAAEWMAGYLDLASPGGAGVYSSPLRKAATPAK